MMNEWILSSSLLIAAVLALRFALRGRISLRLQYGLWAVVLVRLLLPVQLFTSDLGAGAIAQSVDIAEPVRQVYASANEDRYEREYSEAYRQVAAQYEALQQQFDQSYDPIVVEQEAQSIAQRSMELDLTQLLYHIWFAGMVVMTAVIVSCNLHLGLQLKRRRWEYPAADSLLPVYVTEAVPTPCIFGLFRPAVYLTPEAAKGDQVRAHVLTHELTHYRHFDHIWSVLRSVCLVLHWYNPLVWIAAKVSRADAELACDEGALARLGESQRGDYGRTLIGLTCASPVAGLFVTATTMTGSAGSIRERIKLLMKRPRNTVLTVTAVILMVTLIVGCSFAGAPETAAPTESTPSHEGQELPIPADPTASDFKNADGLLIFPGTRWGMTEAELIDALDIQEYGVFSGMRGIHLPKATFCGYPVGMGFYFGQHTKDTEWGLFGVMVKFEQEADFEAVRAMLTEQLGAPDARNSEAFDELWRSDVRVEELVSPEAFEQYREARKVSLTESYLHADDAASTVSCDSAKNTIYFEGWVTSALQIDAAIPRDQTEEVRALFAEGGDPWYLAVLTVQFSDQYSFDVERFFRSEQNLAELTAAEKALVTETYGKDALKKPIFRMPFDQMVQVLNTYVDTDDTFVDLSAFLFYPPTQSYLLVSEEEAIALRRPEILDCELLAEDQVSMLYRFPGEEQTYCATLLKGENWKVCSNHLLISAPLGARALTEEEVEQVRTGFAPSIYNAATGANDGNPLACFTHSMYADVSEMTKFDFLAYYPATAEGTKEELALLIEKYPDYFADWTTETMPLPVHRYDADALDDFMMEFAGIPFRDLPDGRWAHYLEETDSYYNYTSDFGLLGFPCTGGWIYDGGAMLYTDSQPCSVLILSEHDGDYRIQAHLPAIVTGPPSSHTMIPAELPDEEAIAAAAETFVTAYEENINLNRDNGYDHLTVLAADPARTVDYQGKTVPLSKLQENIEYLHGKEAYWKHVGKDAGILPDTFRLTIGTEDLRIDGDTATVTVYDNMTFYYEGNGAPSGMGEAYDLTLVKVDGTWLIADVTQRNDWFDADYKGNPDFDPDALIAAHIP